jgi:hypothetical protein
MSAHNEAREKFLSLLIATGKSIVSTKEIMDLCIDNDLKEPQWFTKDAANRAGRGQFHVPNGAVPVASRFGAVEKVVTCEPEPPFAFQPTFQPLIGTPKPKPRVISVVTDIEDQGIVPTKYKNYVPFGNFEDLKSIIVSRQFYPVFITGPSGNGKSMSVEQVCALLGREYVCVSTTFSSTTRWSGVTGL